MRYNTNNKLTKALMVGDLHVTLSNKHTIIDPLKEFIISTAKTLNVPIIYLGDQYNDFGIANIEVIKYIHNIFDCDIPSIALIGNHDLSKNLIDSFMFLHNDITLVIYDYLLLNEILFISYCSNRRFNEIIDKNKNKFKYIICHHEFNSAQWENGFYSKNDLQIPLIDNLTIISGHIHKHQIITNHTTTLIYVGSPYSTNITDIDNKYLLLFDFENNIYQKINIPEHLIHKPKIYTIDYFNEELLQSIDDTNRARINIYGNKELINKIITWLKTHKNYSKLHIYPYFQDTTIEVSYSKGLRNAFNQFFDLYCKKHNINEQLRIQLQDIIKQELILE